MSQAARLSAFLLSAPAPTSDPFGSHLAPPCCIYPSPRPTSLPALFLRLLGARWLRSCVLVNIGVVTVFFIQKFAVFVSFACLQCKIRPIQTPHPHGLPLAPARSHHHLRCGQCAAGLPPLPRAGRVWILPRNSGSFLLHVAGNFGHSEILARLFTSAVTQDVSLFSLLLYWSLTFPCRPSPLPSPRDPKHGCCCSCSCGCSCCCCHHCAAIFVGPGGLWPPRIQHPNPRQHRHGRPVCGGSACRLRARSGCQRPSTVGHICEQPGHGAQ